MLNLVYSSTAAKNLTRADLDALLHRARKKNARLGITGLLLYKRGEFMQALEGEEAAVRALYAVIRADPRHRRIVTLVDVPVAQPRFPDWSMGFEDLEGADADPLGAARFVESLPSRIEFPWRGSVALQFLAGFWSKQESGAGA
jgi:hypothetical protein